MKKLISVLMFCAILLTFCACGGQEASTSTESTGGMVVDALKMDPQTLYGHIDQTQPIDGVYKIWNSEGVKNMANHPDGNFELLCDVDMQGATLQPIGTDDKPFTGTIEGTNYNILNFYIVLF